MRRYLLHLLRAKQATPHVHKMAVGSLQFLYTVTLGRPEVSTTMPHSVTARRPAGRRDGFDGRRQTGMAGLVRAADRHSPDTVPPLRHPHHRAPPAGPAVQRYEGPTGDSDRATRGGGL